MLLTIPAGTTSKIIEFPVFDSSSTVGALLAGLAYNSGSLTAYYDRAGAAGSATAMSLVTMTKGTWTSLGFIAVDGTNMPGIYQLGIPDAALAAGATQVTINLKGATNMVPVVIIIQLTSVTDYMVNVTQIDGVNNGTHASGMIPADMRDILGTAVSSPATAGILDCNVKNMNNVAATSITTINANQGTTQPINFTGTGASALVKVDVTDIATAAVATGTAQLGVNLVNIAGSAVSTSTAQLGVNAVQIGAAVPGSATIGTVTTCTTATNLTNAPTNGDLTATMKTSVTTAASAATPVATLSGDFSATMKTSLDTEVWNQLNLAFTDATSLNSNSLLDRLRTLGWIIRNKMTVVDASGNVVVYKDDNSTAAFTVAGALTDDSTTTTRLRMA